MGPAIILDKSALQGLSQREVGLLVKHYYVNVTPILVIEILGDLHKDPAERGLSVAQVRQLARKLSPVDSKVNASYRSVVSAELLGCDVRMRGVPVILPGIPVTDRTGQKGMYLKETPEEAALSRWRNDDFSEAEHVLAEAWRQATKAIDLENFVRDLPDSCERLPSVDTIPKLRAQVRSFLANEPEHLSYLQWLMTQLSFDEALRRAMLRRWMSGNWSSLRAFAPYAYHCLEVMLSFRLGLKYGLIGKRPTNRVDLEYLFYLPFCRVFSSSDKCQSALARAFLVPDSTFVDGSVLKADLQSIADHWERLTDAEREDFAYNYGSYPPPNEDSFTYRTWKEHMKPWRPGSGNKVLRMNEEEKAELMERMRPILEALEEASHSDSAADDEGPSR